MLPVTCYSVAGAARAPRQRFEYWNPFRARL